MAAYKIRRCSGVGCRREVEIEGMFCPLCEFRLLPQQFKKLGLTKDFGLAFVFGVLVALGLIYFLW